MDFKTRTRVVFAAAVALGAVYGVARRYSPRIVAHVVEETLVEKAPPGMAGDEARGRFRAATAAIADPDVRLEWMLAVSQRLEKLQRLDGPAFERLLGERR